MFKRLLKKFFNPNSKPRKPKTLHYQETKTKNLTEKKTQIKKKNYRNKNKDQIKSSNFSFSNSSKRVKLKKSLANPIIEPKKYHEWESWQTFNPATVYLNGEIHFLYRAMGEGGVSVLGYASSKDGTNIKKRNQEPVYILRDDFFHNCKSEQVDFSNYSSGGGYSGCEDPRITEINGRIYMIHTSFSNWDFLRMTMSSISKRDFLNHNWEQWSKPVFISPPGEIHKNWALFPEKINGKFAMLTSISPKLSVSYLDSLDFDGNEFISSYYKPTSIEDGWESYCRGIGPPPIKTKYGWLILYHGLDKKESEKYKLGAMVLDLNDPEKVLYRSKEPILEPGSIYENDEIEGGIIYSCGALVIRDTLFVYYGGADKVTCVATTSLEEFMQELTNTKKQTPKLTQLNLLKRIFKKKYATNNKT